MYLKCPPTPPTPPRPIQALTGVPDIMLRVKCSGDGLIFQSTWALFALQLDAAAILVHLLLASCKTEKLNLSFNFLSVLTSHFPCSSNGRRVASLQATPVGLFTDLRCPGCLRTKACFYEPMSGRLREESSNLSSWKCSADRVGPAGSISFSAHISLLFY